MKSKVYQSFLNAGDKEAILGAIRDAEKVTSGEIRVHILSSARVRDILKEGARWFKKLGMHRTKDRNGILLIIAPEARQFAILGDSGINSRVEPRFWDTVRDHIQSSFQSGRFADGITGAVKETGEVLKKFFPWQDGDVNELPDDITESH